ncbi:uncharacterized protein B0H18DRAFT_1124548 [Fomitopsis serialis]|uniref:uncharacterized protein n=1 Tax=Fomitopsis serialis TaxID=139415 RepID=UPI00200742E9|nr:uncharacterized protein B0H18DRAFT_1124548 [Neoantrodia serialis]KAH9916007.1 hypothetical protein B0H18DRAFT_1124548 [Neoantrodia serialis]
MAKLPQAQTNCRWITFDDNLRMVVAAPRRRMRRASQEGAYLARILAQVAKWDELAVHLQALQEAFPPTRLPVPLYPGHPHPLIFTSTSNLQSSSVYPLLLGSRIPDVAM